MLDSWRSALKALLSYFGDYKLHMITTDAIIKYIEHLQITPIELGLRNGGKAPSEKSIRNKVGLLSLILRSAKAQQIIPTNPAQEIDWKELLGAEEKYPKRHREIPLTPEELLHLLDVVKGKYTPKGGTEPTGPYYPFFEVAIWIGLRLGELLGLRWGDVDLDSTPAVLSVERSTYRGIDGPPKSRAGVRDVLLIDRVVHYCGVIKNSASVQRGLRIGVSYHSFKRLRGKNLIPTMFGIDISAPYLSGRGCRISAFMTSEIVLQRCLPT